jgi:hypothetical protein
MTYIQNTHGFRGYQLTFADWLKFRLIEELTNEIDIRFQEKILTNDMIYMHLLTWVGRNISQAEA